MKIYFVLVAAIFLFHSTLVKSEVKELEKDEVVTFIEIVIRRLASTAIRFIKIFRDFAIRAQIDLLNSGYMKLFREAVVKLITGIRELVSSVHEDEVKGIQGSSPPDNAEKTLRKRRRVERIPSEPSLKPPNPKSPGELEGTLPSSHSEKATQQSEGTLLDKEAEKST